MGLSKLAVIALYYRFSELRMTWKVTIIGTAIFVTSYLLVIEILFLFGCHPIPKAWNDAIDGHCVDRTAIFMAGAVASIVTDIILLVIPLPVVSKLQMAMRNKVWIYMTLLIGSLYGALLASFRINSDSSPNCRSVVTSALRISAIVPLFHSKDQTYLFGRIALWMFVLHSVVFADP